MEINLRRNKCCSSIPISTLHAKLISIGCMCLMSSASGAVMCSVRKQVEIKNKKTLIENHMLEISKY